MTGLSAQGAPPPETAPRRARVAWCLYDWANSAFPTVIVTFVFSTYFVSAIQTDTAVGTAQWSQALVLSGLAIAFFSPLFGAIADRTGRRKRWLAVFTVLTVVPAGMLWFAAPDPSWALYALIMFGLANFAFEVGQVFYNAMLPTIVGNDRIGRLSGWGWGLGYAGGLSCLLVALLVFVQAPPPPFGLEKDAAEHVRAVGPLVACWFAVFCLPLFLFVPDRPRGRIGPATAVRDGIAQLVATLRRVREYRNIAWFLFARFFYVDGMNTMFAFGGIYAAKTFQMSVEEVIQFGLLLNVSAGLGAAAFAWIDDRIGARATIAIALTGLLCLGIPLLAVEGKPWFLIIGVPLGLFMGPAQAASRSLMARLAPAEYRNEMFGLFAFSGKATAFIGPAVLGAVTYATGSQRFGMATVVVFIFAGLVLLLWKVREQRSI
jgi:UMF1 family MFS transporter